MKQITNTRIESIKVFLEDIRTRDKNDWYTKIILDAGILEYYQEKLRKEYIKLGLHPYPLEYLQSRKVV